MFTAPDLTDAQVADAVRAGWGLGVDAIEYAAVGFGSYHWRATSGADRWFVTVDDLAARRVGAASEGARDERTSERDQTVGETESLDESWRRLDAALTTAAALRRAGLDFVVAPAPAVRGGVLRRLGERYAVAVYPQVDGVTHSFGPYLDRASRSAVLDLLVALHGATARVRPGLPALVDDFAIDKRSDLAAALADLEAPWTQGPYGEPARALLGRHTDALQRALARYDELAAGVAASPERMVVTHGEPHAANTIATAAGVVLIDWDTTLIAPPERDLWAIVGEDAAIAGDYAERAGVTVRADALELFRWRWDLAEIAIYAGDFRRPHDETEDTRVAWGGLQESLDPARWPPLGG